MTEKKQPPSKQNSLAAPQHTETPTNKETRLYEHEQKVNFTTEFKNYEDNAWYTVLVTLEENDSLRVRYEKFTDDEDQLFEPSLFGTLEDLHEFEKRFRPISVQVQDHECDKLVPGVKVCAAHQFSSDDLRFYDAVVDSVKERKHSHKKDAECQCTFELSWLHGPNAGKSETSTAEIRDIYFVQPITELDPAVASFLKIARRRIESLSRLKMFEFCHKAIETENHKGKAKNKMGFLERMQKGTRRAKRSVLDACSSEGLFYHSM